MECQKVKFKANCSKNWAKSIKILICKLYLLLVVFTKPLKILPAKGTRPNKKYKYKCTLIKSDSKECKTTFWSAEK